MSTARTLPRVHPTGFRHEAFFWDGLDDFLAGAVAFVTHGLEAEMPVMVAVHRERWEPLRVVLGKDAGRVQHVDMARLGHNPARIIPAWRRFVAQADGPCRVIGEPIRDGMRDAHLIECQVNEAALNVAIPETTPLWMLCPYDLSLDPAVLDEARRSHPVVTAPWPSVVEYAGTLHSRTLAATDLPGPRSRTEYRRFRRGDLARIRHFVADRALAAGIAVDRVDDLCLAVSELAANSIDHAGGQGYLRMWQEDDRFVVEVSDSGRIEDPLVGRMDPTIEQARGRGLWMAHQMCDLLQIRTTARGTVLRAVTWL